MPANVISIRCTSPSGERCVTPPRTMGHRGGGGGGGDGNEDGLVCQWAQGMGVVEYWRNWT